MAVFNVPFKQFISKLFSRETPSLETLALFTQQLSVIVNSGIPIVKAMAALTDGATGEFKAVLKNITMSLINGFSLSAALRKHPHIFPTYYVAIIGAAELSGELSKNLKLLIKLLERSVWFKKKIIGSLVYPAFVLFGSILITGILLFWMVPPFLEMFVLYKAELPLPTKILVQIINTTKISYFWWVIGIIGMIILVYIFFFPKEAYDRFLNFIGRIPAIGQLMYLANYAWFSRIFSSLFRSGVPLLVILKHLVTHKFTMAFHEVILDVKNNVGKGEELSSAFELCGCFPSTFVWLVRVGESTGKITCMFEYLADMYEETLERRLAAVLTLVEPFLMFFLGGIVGFIVLACFLPMYSLLSQLK